MERLGAISKGELLSALEVVDGKKPTQRLMVAILYKCGPSVPMIADWFELRVPTIYRWFDRLESEPLLEAVHDRQRPGRPRRLSEEQWERLATMVDSALEDRDDVADGPPIELVRHLIEEHFDVEYSRRHVRRIVDNLEIAV